MTPPVIRVGFIGLGDQGGPMARAIAEAGFDLLVWARRSASLEIVADVAHTACESIDDLAARADVIGLCLREDSDVEDVVFGGGLLAATKPGSVLVNHGTGSPDVCAGWADRCAEVGVDMLDAPVSGGRVGAENRSLTTMVGGDRDAADRCRPVFESFSKLIAHLGGPGTGQFAKLVNNTLMAANLKNSEEILAVADALGFDLGGLVEVLLASSGANFSLEALAKHMTAELAEHYTKMVGKDVDHFSAAARARGIAESPIEASARQGVAGIVPAVARLHPQSASAGA